MVFFIDEARSRPPPPRFFANVNKKMVFFIEGFPYLYITFSPFHKCVCKVQCSRQRGAGECWLNPRNISVCSASNSNLTQAATAEVRLAVRGEGLGPDITAAAAAAAAGSVFEGFKLLLPTI